MSARSLLERIARECRVSKNTASAILRGRGGYAPETVAHVKAVAEDLGYRSNPLVSALMRGLRHARPGTSMGNLAYLHGDDWDRAVANGHQTQLFNAARRRASELGFELDPIRIPSGREAGPGLEAVLRARGVEGLVVAPLGGTRRHLRLDWSRFAAVALGFSMVRPDLHRVATNQYHVMAIAFRELRHLGYRRIGVCLSPNMDARFDFAWQAGLAVMQKKLPVREVLPPLISDNLSETDLSAWLHEHGPDAVITAGSKVGEFLINLGYDIPGDIGLVDLLAEGGEASCATVQRDWTALGRAAIDQVTALLLRNERGLPVKPTRLLIQGMWNPGNSVRRRHRKPSAATPGRHGPGSGGDG